MDQHLEAVASRALIVSRPNKSRDIKDILAGYADDETEKGMARGTQLPRSIGFILKGIAKRRVSMDRPLSPF